MLMPSAEQTHEQFISAFVADEEMTKEYPNEAQRLAAAHTQWDRHLRKSLDFTIVAKSADCGLVSGWASVAVQSDGSLPLDWQDDIIAPELLDKAARNFMLDYRGSGVMHAGAVRGVVVESIVFTKEKQEALKIPPGIVPQGWFVTVQLFDEEAKQQVRNGTLRMFSIQGKIKRVTV